jgi:hypothetical protein
MIGNGRNLEGVLNRTAAKAATAAVIVRPSLFCRDHHGRPASQPAKSIKSTALR